MNDLWNIQYATDSMGTVIGASDARPGRLYRCIGCGADLLRTGYRFVHVHPSLHHPLICCYSNHNAIGLAFQQQIATTPLLKIHTGQNVVQLCVNQWRQNKPFRHGKVNLFCLTVSGQRIAVDIPYPNREYASMSFTDKETDLVFSLDPSHRVFNKPYFSAKPSVDTLLQFLRKNPHFLRPLTWPVLVRSEDIHYPKQKVEILDTHPV